MPDLVVLDLKMPGHTGFDVLQWIRDRGLVLLTIVHSDSSEHQDIERALDLGANDYEKKARDLFEMVEWVRRLDECWAHWHVGNAWRRVWPSSTGTQADETACSITPFQSAPPRAASISRGTDGQGR